MRYNLFINQKAIIESGMDIDIYDAHILSFISQWIKSKDVKKVTFDNEDYFWISYKLIIDNLPLLKMKKDTVYRRLKRMSEMGIINPHQDNKKMGASYYSISEIFSILTYGFSSEPTDKNPYPYGHSSEPPTDENPNPLRIEIRTPTDVHPNYNINNNNIKIDNIINDNLNNNNKERKEKQITDLPFYFQFVEIMDFYYSITNTKPRIPTAYDKFVKYQPYKSISLALKDNPDVSMEEVKNMLTFKSQMLSDPKMKEHYVIETLFRNSNFNKYLQQTITAQNQYSNNFKQLSYEQRTRSTIEQLKQQIRDDEQRNQKKYF